MITMADSTCCPKCFKFFASLEDFELHKKQHQAPSSLGEGRAT